MQDPKTQLFSDENSSSNDKHSTTSIAEDSALYKKWGIDTSFLSVVQEDQSAGLRITRQALEKDLGIHAASIEDAEAVKTIVAAVGRRAARLSAVAIGAIIISSGKLKGNSSISITREAKAGGQAARDHKGAHVSEVAQGSSEESEVSITEQAAKAGHAAREGDAAAVNQTATGDVIEDDVIDVGVDGSLVEYYPGFEDYIREAFREIPEIGPQGERKIRIGIAKDGSGVGAALIALVAGMVKAPTETPDSSTRSSGDS